MYMYTSWNHNWILIIGEEVELFKSTDNFHFVAKCEKIAGYLIYTMYEYYLSDSSYFFKKIYVWTI